MYPNATAKKPKPRASMMTSNIECSLRHDGINESVPVGYDFNASWRNLVMAAKLYPDAKLFGIDISTEMLMTA